MKKFIRTVAILFVLLAFAGIAAAAAPTPEAFSTTGYTTNLVDPDFEFLSNDYIKFHLNAQGTTGGYFSDGTFAFDEWGVVQYIMIDEYPVPIAGANHGLMTITTTMGLADVRFGGVVDYQTNPMTPTVAGSFTFLDGSGEYKKLKGGGAYTGDAGYTFTVDYTPCGGKDQAACPANRCAVFGDDLKIKRDNLEWKISNEGENDLTISRVVVVWPNSRLTQVKLGGKAIYDAPLAPPSADITSGWSGKDKDRQIATGKTETLKLEFGKKGADISQNPWGYTILVEFAEGCAVPFVAFAP